MARRARKSKLTRVEKLLNMVRRFPLPDMRRPQAAPARVYQGDHRAEGERAMTRRPRPGIPLQDSETLYTGLDECVIALEAFQTPTPVPGLDDTLATLRIPSRQNSRPATSRPGQFRAPPAGHHCATT